MASRDTHRQQQKERKGPRAGATGGPKDRKRPPPPPPLSDLVLTLKKHHGVSLIGPEDAWAFWRVYAPRRKAQQQVHWRAQGRPDWAAQWNGYTHNSLRDPSHAPNHEIPRCRNFAYQGLGGLHWARPAACQPLTMAQVVGHSMNGQKYQESHDWGDIAGVGW